jgi:hypothetical protein
VAAALWNPVEDADPVRLLQESAWLLKAEGPYQGKKPDQGFPPLHGPLIQTENSKISPHLSFYQINLLADTK